MWKGQQLILSHSQIIPSLFLRPQIPHSVLISCSAAALTNLFALLSILPYYANSYVAIIMPLLHRVIHSVCSTLYLCKVSDCRNQACPRTLARTTDCSKLWTTLASTRALFRRLQASSVHIAVSTGCTRWNIYQTMPMAVFLQLHSWQLCTG